MGSDPPTAEGGVRKGYQYGSGKGLSLSATGTWFPLLRGVRESNGLNSAGGGVALVCAFSSAHMEGVYEPPARVKD